jgi:uncharacterized membrane protein
LLFGSVLLAATAVAAIVNRRSASSRDHARLGLAIAMVVAGVAHLVQPTPFVQHLPTWVLGRHEIVAATGVVEIALGLLLLPAGRRLVAGRLLALYLLLVWPANAYVAIADVDVDGQPGGWYPWARIPLQVVFIAWALWSTGERRAAEPEATTLADASRLIQPGRLVARTTAPDSTTEVSS